MQLQGDQAVTWDCMQSDYAGEVSIHDLGFHVVGQEPCNDLEP